MKAVIISIGTELTTGVTMDTNASWISAEMTRRGVQVIERITVADHLDDIAGAIRRSLKTADLVVTTGGLGPTADDLTRQALAAAIGSKLHENEEALVQIRRLFDRWMRPFDDANRVQALIPVGCQPILNECGTAPGIRYESDAARCYALPGVPAEMKAMMNRFVAPEIERQIGKVAFYQTTLHTFGMSEAKMGTLLQDLMVRGRNPGVGTAASHAVISVRIQGTGTSPDDARNRVLADAEEVRRRLGKVVFGSDEDSLESVLAKLLHTSGTTLATAESCTGGLLAKRLTDVPGSSAYFLRGYVSYSNESKVDLLNVDQELIDQHGAVSEQVAQAMASGCRTAADSDWAISITGIAGPTGGDPPLKPVGLVFVGLASRDDVIVKKLMLGDHIDRSEIRVRSANAAMNALRLRLSEQNRDRSG